MSRRGRTPFTPCRSRHRHPIHVRPAGPDLGYTHTEWWVRDFGCDVTYLQPGPSPEPWIAPYDERNPS